MMERIRILNGHFDSLTTHGTVDTIFASLSTGQRGWLCTVNVSILMMMRGDARLQSFVDRAALVVADGQPLIWCAPKKSLPERVAGVTLVEALCERAAREGKRVYLLGATKEIVAALAQRLRTQYANLQLDYADGYFTQDQAQARAKGVRAFGTDILFVGMGVPRQEYFLDEQWEHLGVGMAIGVGGSFDVLAGLRARAPLWMQKIGMEWFFRMIQEPRRLFMRYLTTNSLFIWLIFRELMTSKRVK
jgi:N-acetylglucosaminyldiphosphoundecaprenol N-acetyl-beta-D-mannosaminyltransferase